MKKINPVIIPRNHQVEKALKSAEDVKLGNLYNLVAALKTPYEFNSLTKSYMTEPTEEEKVRFTFVVLKLRYIRNT